jgi:hypothetical protein
MGQFRRFLNKAALKEVHLNRRLYTWSNEREHPTLRELIGLLFPMSGNPYSPLMSCKPYPLFTPIMHLYCYI